MAVEDVRSEQVVRQISNKDSQFVIENFSRSEDDIIDQFMLTGLVNVDFVRIVDAHLWSFHCFLTKESDKLRLV